MKIVTFGGTPCFGPLTTRGQNWLAQQVPTMPDSPAARVGFGLPTAPATRIRGVVTPISTDLPVIDRMRMSASEP